MKAIMKIMIPRLVTIDSTIPYIREAINVFDIQQPSSPFIIADFGCEGEYSYHNNRYFDVAETILSSGKYWSYDLE